jgi:hypothetical protein
VYLYKNKVMKQTRLIFLLQICCLLTAVTATAQVKNNIAKLYAYISETRGGNVQVDANGNQTTVGIDHIHYLYAETTGKFLPQWNVFYTRYGTFALQADEAEPKVNVGKLKSTNKPAYISPRKGNRLWKLTLVPMKARIPGNIAALLENNDAVLITQFGAKQFTHTIAKETELQALIYE